MNIKKTQQESGFTLIELLVASAILVVLAGLAVEAFIINRESAYHSLAMQMMGQARTAMEAGKVDSESFDGNLLFDAIGPGEAAGGDGPAIVPGLVLPENLHAYVFHNPKCAVAGCMEDYVITRHCKVKSESYIGKPISWVNR